MAVRLARFQNAALQEREPTMERNNIPRLFLYFFLIGVIFGIFLFPAFGQTPAQTSSAAPSAAPGQFEALAAPIALYPDQLLAKIFIASTYPMEIVEAARWRQQNKGLSGAGPGQRIDQSNLGRQRQGSDARSRGA